MWLIFHFSWSCHIICEVIRLRSHVSYKSVLPEFFFFFNILSLKSKANKNPSTKLTELLSEVLSSYNKMREKLIFSLFKLHSILLDHITYVQQLDYSIIYLYIIKRISAAQKSNLFLPYKGTPSLLTFHLLCILPLYLTCTSRLFTLNWFAPKLWTEFWWDLAS